LCGDYVDEPSTAYFVKINRLRTLLQVPVDPIRDEAES
jgi:hypothetical protein